MQRRTFARGGIAAAIAAGAPSLRAQAAYPNKPLTFVVPFAAGGGGDVVARMMAKGLTERINTSVVVENRVGAGGNIGTTRSPTCSPS